MKPVNASLAGSSGGVSNLPVATAPATSAPSDFLSLLAQIVGEPARQAITPIAAAVGKMGTQTPIAGEHETDLPLETVGFLALSLPLLGEGATQAAAAKTLPSGFGAPGALPAAGGALAGAEAQLLRDMIQGEAAPARDAADTIETLHRPATESVQLGKSAHAAESMHSRPVQVPVGSAQWADEIGARLTVLAQQGQHSASLRLSPEHLGPLEIRIAIRDDQASVWFGAAHADTRAAIEHALPRLRELFESQGMSLADAGVFHEAPRERPNAPLSEGASASDSASVEADAARRIDLPLGLVDAYA